MTENVIDFATRRPPEPPETVPDRLALLCYFMQHGPIHIPASFIDFELPPSAPVFIPVTEATGGGYIMTFGDSEPVEPTPIRPLEV